MDVGGARAMNKHRIVHPMGCKLLLGLGGASCVLPPPHTHKLCVFDGIVWQPAGWLAEEKMYV